MDKETTSFWTEIKKYEDLLADDPESYGFRPLADLYRRLGLFDDAISVARRGIRVHPEFIGGYLALGLACYEKGLLDESREALERVVRANPDDAVAQKTLSQVYSDMGETGAARRTLEILVLLNPREVEGRLMLAALGGGLGTASRDRRWGNGSSGDRG